ncbi:hypothetical protein KAU11_05050, partial [Candidatus Babeliales bacterium]|nr:hypothetical protein [Candidatus Babeliales bacterium]
MGKIEQLSQQMNFLLEVQEKSLAECVQEFDSIMRFLEISAQGDENAEGGIEAVQKFLSEKIELITGEFEQDVADLKEQR